MKRYLNHLLVSILFLICVTACNEPAAKSDSGNHLVAAKDAEWEMSIALYSFHKNSFVTALEKADSTGIKYVEGFSFHQLGKEFNDQSMAHLTASDVQRIKQLLNEKRIHMRSLYVAEAKNANEWKYYFDMGKELGMQFLVAEPPKDQWNMIDSLAGLYDIKLAIHQHAKGLSQYWHPDSVLAALKGHPNFGVCADLGHWARSGLDPVKCLATLEGHILDLHLKDIDTFNDVKANDVVVGSGVIDFPGVVSELKRQHFKGMVNVECEHDTDNNLKDVIQAINYFNGLSK